LLPDKLPQCPVTKLEIPATGPLKNVRGKSRNNFITTKKYSDKQCVFQRKI
jgi:hypothetical protein